MEVLEQGWVPAGYGWIGVAVAVLLSVVFWRVETKSGKPKGTVPPGSAGWPLVGETLKYLGNARANRMPDFFTSREAKYGKVFKSNLMFNWTVFLPAPEGNKFLFANENKLVHTCWPPSVTKLLGKGTLANKSGDDHKQVRRMFTTFFGPEGLQSFVTRMDALARSNLVEYWQGKEQILGVAVVKEFTFAIAADLFVSVKQGDPEFRLMAEAVEDFLAGIMQLPIDLPGTVYHKARLAREAILRTLDPIIQRRQQELKDGKASGNQDLISVLLTTANENGSFMSMEDVKDNILLMLFAGHDTSSITTAVVLKYLFLNPQCLQQVIQEQKEIAEAKAGAPLTWEDTRKMKYTWRVVQETLRLQPPAQGTFRKVIQDFKYEGHTIPKGWMVMWNVCRSHYSPKHFPNPKTFDPSRFEGSGPAPFTFVPFGGGPHMCLGNEFARTEMMVYLHYLVLTFEWEMVDPEEFITINPMPLFTKGLPLRVHRKENSLALE